MTPPEARLWQALRDRNLDGLKFRRQHPLGVYVLDFYCVEARLAVEVDGMDHDLAHDERRDQWVATQGVRTLRLAAELVFKDLDEALLRIIEAARS